MGPNDLRKHLILAVLLAMFLAYNLRLVSAASGGRMGGQFFSSDTKSSSSSSSSSSRSSYSSEDYWREPYRSYYSHSRTNAFYPGRDCSSDCPKETNVDRQSEEGSGLLGVCVIVSVGAAFLILVFMKTEKKSVVMVQVGLLGKAQSLHRDLNDIASSADTSTLKGLNYILTETTLALLRHPDYCISAYSHVDQKWSIEGVEKCFNRLSIQEREKFDMETLVNVNNVKIKRTHIQKASRLCKDYIVVTVLVAAQGSHKLPVINNTEDLKEALQYLSSIHSHRILAAEVLWTPQNENDTLSEQELLEDYPLLRPIDSP